MQKTIWIVEDDAASRDGLAALLRHEGYDVASAGNGKESLDLLLLGTPPDLILLDMMAPIFDGWRFLEQRKRSPDLAGVPVVIVTGLGIGSVDWARSLGASDFVRKPIQVEPFLEKVRQYLGGKEVGT